MNPPSTDQEHLKLLSIFHYVVGAIAVLLACIPLIHLGLGIAVLASPESFAGKPGDQPFPPGFAWIFVAFGAGFFLAGQALAVCIILSGRFIARRTKYTFVFVVACLECMFMPLGTALGIFTIIVLSRPSVKQLFGRYTSPAVTA